MRLITHFALSASLVISFSLLALSAHATPLFTSNTSPLATDELDTLLANRGLLSQITQVRLTVGDRASALVENAMGFLGVPYKRGGISAETGFDCSGFVRSIYEQTAGLLLPRSAAQQAAAGD